MYTYQFKLYPTKKQIKILESQLEICRLLYNKSLEYKIKEYKDNKKIITLFTLNKLLPIWKQENQQFKQVYAQCLQEVQHRLDEAYSHFFAKNNKFPRFKAKNRYRSITYKQNGFQLLKNSIKVSKIGTIKCNFTQDIIGNIKRITIVRHSDGYCYASITTDHTKIINTPITNKVVGVDLGISSLATLSDGTVIENPKHLKRSSKQIARLNRKYQKTNSEKNCKSLNKAYTKLTNRRKDFLDKLSLGLIKNYDVICFEKLNIESMKQSGFKPTNRAMSDVCWGKLIEKTQYKAESAGKKVILVNPKNTSKTCSKCGIIDKNFTLKQKQYICNCGNSMNRDLNASINILRLGLQSLEKS